MEQIIQKQILLNQITIMRALVQILPFGTTQAELMGAQEITHGLLSAIPNPDGSREGVAALITRWGNLVTRSSETLSADLGPPPAGS